MSNKMSEILAIIFIFFIMWFSFSFVEMEMNPSHWSTDIRFFFTMTWLCFSAFIISEFYKSRQQTML